MDRIPIIDVSDLASPDAAARSRLAARIGDASRHIGFFLVSGRGVPMAEVDAAFAAARAFFALPQATKDAVSIRTIGNNRGYVALGGERLDPNAPPDRKEAFNIGLELPPDHPEMNDGTPFRGANGWPDLPGFRQTMLAYFDAAHRLGVALHQAFALDLGLADEHAFDSSLDRPMAILRLLHYPAPSGSGDAIGAGEHTDYGNVTLLATDGVAGLQVRRRDGTWIDAPHAPGALIVNIGDCLMRWTNDIYVSTPHRVISPARDRYSIAFFLDPNPDADVRVLPACVSDDRPARYPPTTGAAYLKSKLDPSYAHAKPS